jgi:hypothetical protein
MNVLRKVQISLSYFSSTEGSVSFVHVNGPEIETTQLQFSVANCTHSSHVVATIAQSVK